MIKEIATQNPDYPRTQMEIAEALGESITNVADDFRRLVAYGLLNCDRVGRRFKYTLKEPIDGKVRDC